MGVQRRIIAQVDPDAFFASVEQLDRPGLRACPVVVGIGFARSLHHRG